MALHAHTQVYSNYYWSGLDCSEPHAYVCKFEAFNLALTPPSDLNHAPPPGYFFDTPSGQPAAMAYNISDQHMFHLFTDRMVGGGVCWFVWWLLPYALGLGFG